MVTDVAVGDGVEVTSGKFPNVVIAIKLTQLLAIKHHDSPLTVITAGSVNMLGNQS